MACSAAVRAVDLVLVRLDCDARAAEEALALLADDERDRAARYSLERERRRFVVARATLRRLLGERLGVSPRSIALTQGAHGKPALAAPFSASGLRFNVSHSDGLAAYAFSPRGEVGVDIEAVRAMPDADPIARRFFSERECRDYFSLAPAERCRAFFRCWTRKEAFIKALGDGLSHPLAAFDVSLAPGEAAQLLRVGDRAGDESGWALRAFDPGPAFVGAIVVQQS